MKNTEQTKELSSTDYVVYDRKNDLLACFLGDKKIVIYGSKEEAQDDVRDEEEVVSCTELPQHWQVHLLKQINA